MPRAGPMTMKRINRELADLSKEDLGGMTLAPTDANLFEWKATIPGPEGSLYDGGLFHVDITLPDDYPFSAPKATFVTKIYHMNISERGQVCVDLLKHNWSPALSLFKVMLSLSSLLTDPNPKDPLVPGIATQYNRQRTLHDNTARQWVQLYALPNQASSSNPTATPAQRPPSARASVSTQRTLRTRPASATAVPTAINGAPSHPIQQLAQIQSQQQVRTRSSAQTTLTRVSMNGHGSSSSHHSTPTPITISDDEGSSTSLVTTATLKRKSDSSQGGSSSSSQSRQRRRLNGDSSVIVIDD